MPGNALPRSERQLAPGRTLDGPMLLGTLDYPYSPQRLVERTRRPLPQCDRELTAMENRVDVDVFEGRTEIASAESGTGMFEHVVENEGFKFLTCNIAYTRGAFHSTGGFDERFRMPNREDTDLALRVLESGFRSAFITDMLVSHPVVRQTLRQRLGEARHCYFEPLLLCKHRRFWRELDRQVVGKVGRAIPRFEMALIVTWVLLVAGIGIGLPVRYLWKWVRDECNK